jgi:Yip1 domain
MLLWLFFRPNHAFADLAEKRPSGTTVFFRLVLWMALIPPLAAYIGTRLFGWRLGAGEPIFISDSALLSVCAAYFLAMLFGFLSSARVAQWMAATYGARLSFGIHLALISIVAAPLIVGSLMHLFPHVFLNVLALVPALIWSMYLLYAGLPVVLKISPERGMLMASSLIGYLLVAAVSLLGITVYLWVIGIGPQVGV